MQDYIDWTLLDRQMLNKSIHCKQLYRMQYWWSTLLGAALGKEAQEHAKHCGKLTGVFNFTMMPQVPYAFHKKQTSLRPKNLASFFFFPLSLSLSEGDKPQKNSKQYGRKAGVRILDA